MKAPDFLFKYLLPNRRASIVSERDLNLSAPAVEIIPSKGRVSAPDSTKFANGSLKYSESSINLANIVEAEIRDGQLSFRGKRVLELNCGPGLAGTLASLKGASTVHFHDSSAETLRLRTIPTLLSSQSESATWPDLSNTSSHSQSESATWRHSSDTRFYAGDFEELHAVLSLVDLDFESRFSEDDSMKYENNNNNNNSNDNNNDNNNKGIIKRKSGKLSGSQAWKRGNEFDTIGGYDVILISDLNNSVKSLKNLHVLIMKCLRPPYGIIYLEAKKSVVKQLRIFFDEEGLLGAHLVYDVADREFWKFFFK